MRRVLCTMMIVCLLSGCHNQTMPVTNPFMSQSRVPPPSTRTPMPGTAQPYYPGDPAPTLQPTAPTSPPGGWNTSPQSSPISSAPSDNWFNGVEQAAADITLGPAGGESMQVPTDNQSLRFAQPAQYVESSVASPSQATVQPQQFTDTLNQVTPTQQVLPTPIDQQRQVSIRAIPSSELPSAGFDSSSPRTTRDGFRPQGSSRTARDQIQAVVRPTETQAAAPSQESTTRFGFDPQYQWLRGQLQQSPTTGQWQLRYIHQGGNPDQFGGNVVIANPQVLGNLQPGEHISVHGSLEMMQIDAHAALPAYRITVLQRQQQGLR
jgi:hypothetical protein